MDDRLLGKRYEKDYTVETLERIYDDLTVAVSVPVNVDLKAEHWVLDLSRSITGTAMLPWTSTSTSMSVQTLSWMERDTTRGR